MTKFSIRYFLLAFFCTVLLLPNSAQSSVTSANFRLNKISYDFIDSNIIPEIEFINGNQADVTGRIFFFSFSIPGVKNINNYLQTFLPPLVLLTPPFSITQTDLQLISTLYPDGNVPYQIKLFISNQVNSYNPADSTLIAEYTGTVQIIPLTDNHEFKIGVVQVVPPGFNLDQQNLCFWKDDTWGGQGYIPGGVATDCAARWDWGTNAPFITTRSYPLSSILFSDEPYTAIDNVTSIHNRGENKAGTIKISSLKTIGKFWENLLKKHNIVDKDTLLKKNPRFTVEFLPPVEKTNTLTSSDHAQVTSFFTDTVLAHNLDTSFYDFVVYIQYQQLAGDSGFTRSFAAKRNSYIAFSLDNDSVSFNINYLTLVHEMGHQIFRAMDLYDVFGIQYPKGVPDPQHFPQINACIMAPSFGKNIVSPTLVSAYNTTDYDAFDAGLGLDRFYTENPENFVLCVDDISRIMKGQQNPNCSQANFYAGNCGACNSINYLSCPNFSPPVLNLIGNKNIAAGETLTFSLNAIDADGNPIFYSASNLPSEAAMDSTGTFLWTPTINQIGVYPNIHFEASDGALTDSEDITISVTNANQPPVLNAIGNQSVNEGQALSLTVSATDPDADPLTFSASSLPAGAVFNPTAQTFSWTPSFAQSGNYSVSFTVSDGNLSDTQTITVTVNNVNSAPVLSLLGNKVINEGQKIFAYILANDPDQDRMTFSSGVLPSGAALKTVLFGDINGDNVINILDVQAINNTLNTNNPQTDLNADGIVNIVDTQIASNQFNLTIDSPGALLAGVFEWTPTYTQSGNYPLTFSAADPLGLIDTKTVTITVVDVPLSDLVASAITTPVASLYPADILPVDNSVNNAGAAAAGIFTMEFHLSKDNVYGGADDVSLNTTRSVSSLATGATSSATTALTIPSNLPTGNYYICAAADTANTVMETNDGNNTKCSSIIVKVIPKPVAHLKFDDAAGSTALDASGNNNSGELFGPLWSAGILSGALNFNGVNDYVQIPNSPTVQNVQNADYTLAAWFKPNQLPPGTGSANDASYGVIVKTGWHMGITYDGAGKFRGTHWFNDNTAVGVASAHSFAPGSFHHVALIANHAAGTFKIFVDGILEGTATLTNKPTRDYGVTTWKIGTAFPGGAQYRFAANGIIDDARIYNVALTDSEIGTLGNQPPVGLVGYWKFNEGTGTSALDSSVNKNTLALNGGVSWVTGKTGTALNFDGVNDSGLFPQSGAFNVPSSGTLSIATWIKTTANRKVILQAQGNGGVPLYYLSIGPSTGTGADNKLVAYLRNNANQPKIPFNGTTTINDGVWHHVALVINNTEAFLYVDGKQDAATIWAGGPITTSPGSLRLGGFTNYFYQGQIDEFRLYNRALGLAEIQDLYANTGVIAAWKIDEAVGLNTLDDSGNFNTATLSGPLWTSGFKGAGLSFNGVNDYATIPNTPLLQTVQNGDYTLAARFKANQLPPNTSNTDASYAVLMKSGYHMGIQYNNLGKFQGTHWFNDNTAVVVNSARTFAPGTFHHVAMVVNKTTLTLKIYIDGILEGTTTLANKPTKDFGTSTFKLGNAIPGGAQYRWAANGTIDDAKIFNSALGDQQILILNNQ